MAYGTVGYQSPDGVDIGQKFSAYAGGNKAPTSNYQISNGQDLSVILQPLIGAQQVAATNFQGPDGRDLALYYGTGGPVANPTIPNVASEASGSRGSQNLSTSVLMNVSNDGTAYATPPTSGSANFNWYLPQTSGIGNSYWVKFSYTTSGGGLGTFQATNNATGWTQITGNINITLTLTFGAGGSATASRFGTMTMQVASDPNGANIVSQGTCNWNLTVTITA
jgi:hypothetical protein